jgi:hypothetical protein
MRDMEKKKAHDARRHAERMKTDLEYRLRKVLNTIRHRCDTDKHKASIYYQGRGVKNFLTLDDLVYLWEFNRAYHLKRPSIDRIDPDGHYERSNCRFIELSLNVSRARHPLRYFLKHRYADTGNNRAMSGRVTP